MNVLNPFFFHLRFSFLLLCVLNLHLDPPFVDWNKTAEGVPRMVNRHVFEGVVEVVFGGGEFFVDGGVGRVGVLGSFAANLVGEDGYGWLLLWQHGIKIIRYK